MLPAGGEASRNSCSFCRVPKNPQGLCSLAVVVYVCRSTRWKSKRDSGVSRGQSSNPVGIRFVALKEIFWRERKYTSKSRIYPLKIALKVRVGSSGIDFTSIVPYKGSNKIT